MRHAHVASDQDSSCMLTRYQPLPHTKFSPCRPPNWNDMNRPNNTVLKHVYVCIYTYIYIYIHTYIYINKKKYISIYIYIFDIRIFGGNASLGPQSSIDGSQPLTLWPQTFKLRLGVTWIPNAAIRLCIRLTHWNWNWYNYVGNTAKQNLNPQFSGLVNTLWP